MAKGKEVNAGVHNTTGIEFQKHCALYLILDNYSTLKNRKYFLCFEHHDDFLFCYQDQNSLVELIESYQAKKASTSWGNSKKLHEILKKIAESGDALNRDTIPKTTNYSHSLQFITNDSIHLIAKVKKGNDVSCIINAENITAKFTDLPKEIKDALTASITKLLDDKAHINQLDHTSLAFIDMNKTAKAQIQVLIGKFSETFNNSISDNKAAIETLLSLFRNVESVFNQNKQIKLLDESKRVDCEKINEAIGIITTKQKAYKTWRDKKDQIAKELNISVLYQKQFELDFTQSFDFFKDLNQTQHLAIKRFAETNKEVFEQHTSEQECVIALCTKFKKEKSTQLNDLQIKAAMYAAYFEVIE